MEQHYIEDSIGNFRLKYSKEKLRWALSSPGYYNELHFLIRNSKNKKILASIVGVPKTAVILGTEMLLCEGNFLAVHRSLRSKKMG